jgi:hypothetical protein
MSQPADDPTAPLIPDPERLRTRLAELAREQSMLRKVLRAVIRNRPPLPPPLNGRAAGERGAAHAG